MIVFNEYGAMHDKDVSDTDREIAGIVNDLFDRLARRGACNVELRAVSAWLSNTITAEASLRILKSATDMKAEFRKRAKEQRDRRIAKNDE